MEPPHADFPRTAFILGAGLGTRLRPLTEVLPKPLIPVGQAPLIQHALDHAAGTGVQRFVVNTHHLAGRFPEFFPQAQAGGCPLHFVHEPEVLETAGGLWNIGPTLDLLGEAGPILIYNGDVLTTLPLAQLWAAHRESGAEITLALRPADGPLQITFDAGSGRVTDIGSRLHPETPGNALFTGVYIVEPAFRARLQPGVKESVVAVWRRMLVAGVPIAGAMIPAGEWRDLGSRGEYLRAIAELAGPPERSPWRGLEAGPLVHPTARLGAGAELRGACQLGAGTVVGAGAVLESCVVWPGAEIAPGAHLSHCIVTGRSLVSGNHFGIDI